MQVSTARPAKRSGQAEEKLESVYKESRLWNRVPSHRRANQATLHRMAVFMAELIRLQLKPDACEDSIRRYGSMKSRLFTIPAIVAQSGDDC